jgi:hypothetical protein
MSRIRSAYASRTHLPRSKLSLDDFERDVQSELVHQETWAT